MKAKTSKHSIIRILASIGVTASLIASNSAWAEVPTLVQFSTDGTGDGTDASYDINSIMSFDWVDNFSTVIDQDIVSCTSTTIDCTTPGITTLDAFFAGSVVGDTVTFDVYAQAYLDGMTGSNPTPPTGLLSDYEITATLSATESAVVISSPNSIPGTPVVILFTSISGTYTFYYDTCGGGGTCNANLDAGTGFDDGTAILTGGVVGFSAPSTFTATGPNQGAGSAFLINTVTSYNNAYIEADPASGAPLVDSTFDSFLNLAFGAPPLQQPISIGATIGESGNNLTVAANDLILRSDATTSFSVGVPEPTTLALLGMGLFGIGGMRKFKR